MNFPATFHYERNLKSSLRASSECRAVKRDHRNESSEGKTRMNLELDCKTARGGEYEQRNSGKASAGANDRRTFLKVYMILGECRERCHAFSILFFSNALPSPKAKQNFSFCTSEQRSPEFFWSRHSVNPSFVGITLSRLHDSRDFRQLKIFFFLLPFLPSVIHLSLYFILLSRALFFLFIHKNCPSLKKSSENDC